MKAAHSRKSGLKNKKNIPITFRWRREIQDFEWDRKIRRYLMAVSFILERHADADGKNVFPSVGTIADLAGIGIAKVREALKAMEDAGFIRTYGKTRYGSKLRRLVYKNHDFEVDDTRSTSKSETRSTTKRTQGTLGSPTSKSPKKAKSLSRSAKSPKATVAPHSATSKPIISFPKVKDDLVVVERMKDQPASANSKLGKMTARGKSVVTKSQAQIDSEKFRIGKQVDEIVQSLIEDDVIPNQEFSSSWEHKEREIVEIFNLVYNDFDLFSLICRVVQYSDRKEWKWVAHEMTLCRWLTDERRNFIESFFTRTASQAFVAFIDAIKRHDLSKTLVAKVASQDLEVDDIHALSVSEIRSRFYRVKESIVIDIRDEQRRFHLQRISVSATRTGSDPIIVEKIVETVTEKVERW